MRAILPIFLLLILALPAAAQDAPVYGPRLEGFDYPHPVQIFRFTSQNAPMEMAYMDVKPAKPDDSAEKQAFKKVCQDAEAELLAAATSFKKSFA